MVVGGFRWFWVIPCFRIYENLTVKWPKFRFPQVKSYGRRKNRLWRRKPWWWGTLLSHSSLYSTLKSPFSSNFVSGFLLARMRKRQALWAGATWRSSIGKRLNASCKICRPHKTVYKQFHCGWFITKSMLKIWWLCGWISLRKVDLIDVYFNRVNEFQNRRSGVGF